MTKTYTLKVNINCCNACPKTLRKLLENFKGVESFKIDKEKSLVSVTGKINLDQLFVDIKKKIKKTAELIKKESSDPEKKQQSEEENINFGNNYDFQNGFLWPHPAYQEPSMMPYDMPPPPPPPPPHMMPYDDVRAPLLPPPHGFQDPSMMPYARAPPPPPPGIHDFYGPVFYHW